MVSPPPLDIRFRVDWYGGGRFEAPFANPVESGIYEDHEFTFGSDAYSGAFREAAPGRGFITLRNPDGLFNSENQLSPLTYRVPGTQVYRNFANLRHDFICERHDLPGGPQILFQCHIYPPFEEIDAEADLVTFELAHKALYDMRELISFSNPRDSTLERELEKLGGAPISIASEDAADRLVPPYDFGRISRRRFINNLVLMTASDAYCDRLGRIVFQPLDTPRVPFSLRNVDFLDLSHDSRVFSPLTDVVFLGRERVVSNEWIAVGSGEARGPFLNLRRVIDGNARASGDGFAVRDIDPPETYQ